MKIGDPAEIKVTGDQGVVTDVEDGKEGKG